MTVPYPMNIIPETPHAH